ASTFVPTPASTSYHAKPNHGSYVGAILEGTTQKDETGLTRALQAAIPRVYDRIAWRGFPRLQRRRRGRDGDGGGIQRRPAAGSARVRVHSDGSTGSSRGDSTGDETLHSRTHRG